MGVKERREREKLEIRDLILDAARELFLAEGYEGVSMRKVAERIEYSPTSIYLHFADKDELFRELCHQDFARLADNLNLLANEPDVIERIRQIGLAYIQFGTRYPNHYKLMFMTAHPPKQLVDCDYEVKGNPEKDAYALLRLQVQEAIDSGAFREEYRDADAISQTLWAAVHGVISLQIAKGSDGWVEWKPLEDRARIMTDAILRGLLKEPTK
jgi:AcrR family transcriptional regulator